MTQDAGKCFSVFQLFLVICKWNFPNSLPSSLSLSSHALLSTATLDLTPCSQPSCGAKTLEAIPKRGKMFRVQQFCFLSKQNASTPGYPLSQPQIPTELAFSQQDGHCLCFHYPLSDLNHPETFLFSMFWGGREQKWKNTFLIKTPQKAECTEMVFYWSSGLILRGPLQNCSLGWIQWVQPSFKSLQRWDFP